jgi:hypothetical protein
MDASTLPSPSRRGNTQHSTKTIATPTSPTTRPSDDGHRRKRIKLDRAQDDPERGPEIDGIIDEPARRSRGNRVDDDAQPTEEDYCVICLDLLAGEATEIQPCSHRQYHLDCLATWLRSVRLCPLCKTEVAEVVVDGEPIGQQDWKPRAPHRSTSPSRQQPSSDSGALNVRPRDSGASSRPQRARFDPHPSEDDDIPIELTDRRVRMAVRTRSLVYERRLYSFHIGSNRFSRFCVLTPELFRSNPPLVDRARRWIRRELLVFPYLHHRPRARGRSRQPTQATVLLDYLTAALRTFDIQGSQGEAEDYIQEFIGRGQACVFLHELRNWLRCPCRTLAEWDAQVRYAAGLAPSHARWDDQEWINRWRRVRDKSGMDTRRRRRREDEPGEQTSRRMSRRFGRRDKSVE